MGVAIRRAHDSFTLKQEREPIGSNASIAEETLAVHELDPVIVEVSTRVNGILLDEDGIRLIGQGARRVEGFADDAKVAEIGIVGNFTWTRPRMIQLDKRVAFELSDIGQRIAQSPALERRRATTIGAGHGIDRKGIQMTRRIR